MTESALREAARAVFDAAGNGSEALGDALIALGLVLAGEETDPEPIHQWFGLTYANYLVLPRSVLQSMPREWQSDLCSLLDDAREAFGYLDWPRYTVLTRDSRGRYRRDSIPHYHRGRTRLRPAL